jgi:hypothetical protein
LSVFRLFVLSLNDACQTAPYRAACFRDVTFSLGYYRRIGDMAKRQGDNAPHDNAPVGELR